MYETRWLGGTSIKMPPQTNDSGFSVWSQSTVTLHTYWLIIFRLIHLYGMVARRNGVVGPLQEDHYGANH